MKCCLSYCDNKAISFYNLKLFLENEFFSQLVCFCKDHIKNNIVLDQLYEEITYEKFIRIKNVSILK